MCSRDFVLSRLLPVPSLGNSVRGELSHLTALQVVLTCSSAKLMDSKDLTPTEAGLSLLVYTLQGAHSSQCWALNLPSVEWAGL